MKRIHVAFDIPVPSLRPALGFAWRFVILCVLVAAGRLAAEVWPAYQWYIAFVTGIAFACACERLWPEAS